MNHGSRESNLYDIDDGLWLRSAYFVTIAKDTSDDEVNPLNED